MGYDCAVRVLSSSDQEAALEVINTAARWYEEILPVDALHPQEMDAGQWQDAARRMVWYGSFLESQLIAVMALQPIPPVALVRHGYVLPPYQRQRIGTALLEHLERAAGDAQRIIIGTYAANYKARAVLEKRGYRLSADSAAILARYFDVAADRAAQSVTYEKVLRQSPRN
ncbi:MAG TPA: GNAT family N-acetyltransferase [Burkholderiales bacterium]|nr:GNAT family N-acetyltransferase [Burkholderiales bacterium]